MSFVFYDTETTGKHKTFDQIVQFAAIKTDWQLQEEDRFEIRCRLHPHVIPHPEALCITRSSIDGLLDPARPSHYQMVCSIVAKLAEWGPATFVGYNSLGFDEHLLRQAFYQTLHYPYLTSTRPNSRIDALAIVHAAAAHAPGALTIPTGEAGRQTFALSHLAPANGFDHHNAHDALADVEAMIHICRRVSQSAPHLWSNALRFSQKATVEQFLDDELVVILSQVFFGKAHHYAVTKIGGDPSDTNAVYLLDLTCDLDLLRASGAEELALLVGRSPRPIRKIRANGSPTLTEIDHDQEFNGFSATELERRAAEVRDDQEFSGRLRAALASAAAPREVAFHLEERIHEGLPQPEDRRLLEEFHREDWSARPDIVRRFQDERLRLLGARLLYLEQPQFLSDRQLANFDQAVARRLLGQGNISIPWLTIDAAFEETERLAARAEAHQNEILSGLNTYLLQRQAFARQSLGL